MNGQIQGPQLPKFGKSDCLIASIVDHIRDILISEKTPYIITIFFAAVAWTIIRTVDSLAGLPVIEYSTRPNNVQFSGNYNSQVAGVRLRNITRDVTFGCLIFSVEAFSEDNRYLFIKPTDKRYILRGTSVVSGDSQVLNTYFLQVIIEDFSPGGDIEFGVLTSGRGEIRPRVMRCPRDESLKINADANKGVEAKNSRFPVFIERSVQTRFVENELCYLWMGLFVWFVLMIIIIWVGRPSSKGACVCSGHTGD